MHHRPHGEPACASCKHQRKKCKEDCMMAPFFPVQNQKQFRAVHKIFGVSNVAKQLKKHINDEHRRRSVDSLVWEATCWENDPIHGPYGEFQRVVDELNLYKSQYYKLASKLPTTSQGTTNLMYSPQPSPGPLSVVPHGVLINNGWNSNGTAAAGTNPNPNPNPNNGGISMMDNINGGLFNSVTDYQNGNLRVDSVVPNVQFPYANTNNNGGFQDLDAKSICGPPVINGPHQPQQRPPTLEQVIQSIGNQLQEQRDRPNGGTVILPQRQHQQHQHHAMATFNRQFFNVAGQCDSAAVDAKPRKIAADMDSSSLRGGQGTHRFAA